MELRLTTRLETVLCGVVYRSRMAYENRRADGMGKKRSVG